MDQPNFDFAIIGAGAAGLHLALAMVEEPYFDSKKILILEKGQKDKNDRTWCYWEKGKGKWDDIIHQSWNHTEFITSDKTTSLNLGDYNYKMIRAIDFYNMAKSKLKSANQITWVNDEVKEMKQGFPNTITANKKSYKATHVFDSIIAPGFFKNSTEHINLLQHFEGWVIETKTAVFNSDSFVMMDFRLKYPKTTSFIYILPENPKKALVEFTFFSPDLVKKEEYENYLKKYITEILKVTEYNVTDTEQGIIPMSNYPFHKLNNHLVTKIGTAGSWVKGSSGYSFKNCERYSAKIIKNIKKGTMPGHNLFKSRFKKYDTLFLDVLYYDNELGEQVFTDMYTKNQISSIFNFLDEESTIIEEIKIISTLKWKPFTKALIKHLLKIINL